MSHDPSDPRLRPDAPLGAREFRRSIAVVESSEKVRTRRLNYRLGRSCLTRWACKDNETKEEDNGSDHDVCRDHSTQCAEQNRA